MAEDRPDQRVHPDKNDQTRRRNLSALVTLIHRDGAQPRSALTRETGLNRATIAALVGELVDAGVVTEQAATASGHVGRPSATVAPGEYTVLAVNPETTGVRVAIVGFGTQIRKQWYIPQEMPPTPDGLVEVVAHLVRDLQPQHMLGIGVAVPGVIETSSGTVRNAPHLGWRGEPVGERISQVTGYPAYVINDAMAGAVGEWTFGYGRDTRDLVYLNGVSGIGGGVISHGKPHFGSTGAAGEYGHMVIRSGGRLCHCGRHGCFETEVSLSRLSEVLGRQATLEGLDEDLRAMRDPDALAEVSRQIDALIVAVANVCTIHDPELVVLGGYLGALYSLDPERIRGAAHAAILTPETRPIRFTRATDVATSVLLGAAELAYRPFLADPVGMVNALRETPFGLA